MRCIFITKNKPYETKRFDPIRSVNATRDTMHEFESAIRNH